LFFQRRGAVQSGEPAAPMRRTRLPAPGIAAAAAPLKKPKGPGAFWCYKQVTPIGVNAEAARLGRVRCPLLDGQWLLFGRGGRVRDLFCAGKYAPCRPNLDESKARQENVKDVAKGSPVEAEIGLADEGLLPGQVEELLQWPRNEQAADKTANAGDHQCRGDAFELRLRALFHADHAERTNRRSKYKAESAVFA